MWQAGPRGNLFLRLRNVGLRSFPASPWNVSKIFAFVTVCGGVDAFLSE
jgi:hypothetical protein